MNLYTCAVDLKDDAKALAFAQALEQWIGYLKSQGTILGWRLLRRKLNLASGANRDFLLEIEVKDLAQLDSAFRLTGTHDEAIEAMYRNVNTFIAQADFGLYRPFPDPERAERMALV